MYQALYRKYRPAVFGDVIGQEPVTKTLKNQIKNATFAHAYLFTGTRGTGKTTCARIFAKAINCLSPVDGEPCGECEVCRGITDGSVTDVIEIDAATNSGVDSVRELREEVAFSPVLAKYKVYIIDEVHMLSPAAYNALLKTIEEPPSHAVFILATTEVNKVPSTSASRCQRFDFRRVNVGTLVEHLKKVVASEGAEMDDESLLTVARLGDGSVRDSLSVLDKVIGLSSAEEVREVLGVIDTELIHDLMKAAAEQNIDALYTAVNSLYNGAKDLGVLCRELLDEYRALLVVKNVRNRKGILDLYDRDEKRLEEIAGLYTTEHILYAIDIAQQTLQELSRSSNKRADMEICLLRISRPKLNEGVKALTARVSELENELEKLKRGGITVSAPSASPSSSVPAAGYAEARRTDTPAPAKKVAKNADMTPPTPEDVFGTSPTSFVPADDDFIPAPPPDTGDAPVLPDVSEYSEPPKSAASAPAPIKTEQIAAPVKKAAPTEEIHDGEYREFGSWEDFCKLVADDDMFLGMMLKTACSAVYRNTELLILCKTEQDLTDIDNSHCRESMKKALDALRKTHYTISIKIGRKGEYLNAEEYKDLENNPLFDFE